MTVYSNKLLITDLNQQKHTNMKQTNNELLERNDNRVLSEFAKRLDVTPMQIMEHNKEPHICDVRHLYCKLRHDWHGLTYSETGREIGRCHGTVKYGVRRINDLLLMNNNKILKMWNKVRDISGLYL